MADKQASSLYVRYAGFEHVFVLRHEERTQYDVLAALIQSRYLTYVDWSSHNPYSVRRHQKAAYQDCVDKYGKKVTRQVAIDIDEYPCRPGVKFHAEISQKLLPPRNTRMSARPSPRGHRRFLIHSNNESCSALADHYDSVRFVFKTNLKNHTFAPANIKSYSPGRIYIVIQSQFSRESYVQWSSKPS